MNDNTLTDVNVSLVQLYSLNFSNFRITMVRSLGYFGSEARKPVFGVSDKVRLKPVS